MKTNKVFNFPIAIAAICLMVLVASPSAWAVTVTPNTTDLDGGDKTQFSLGESFYLEINVDTADGIAGAALTIGYDQTVFEVDAVNEEDNSGTDLGYFVTSSDSMFVHIITQDTDSIVPSIGNKETLSAEGKIMLAGAYIDSSTGGGSYTGAQTLFKIKFKVKSDATAPSGPHNFTLYQTELFNPDAGWGTDDGNGVFDEGTDDAYEAVPPLTGAYPKTHTSWIDTPDDLSDDFYDVAYTFAGPAAVNVTECVDSDSDGLCDSVETDTNTYVNTDDTGTDPADSDTDDDGLLDGDEVNTYNTNPVKADTDEDGMDDQWEVNNGTDPTVDDAAGDLDQDGLTNIAEFNNGCTSANDADSDDDGVNDGAEITNQTDPCVPDNNAIAIDMDSEQDGIQSTKFVGAGDTVTIQIWAVNVTDLSGVNFTVTFDETQLSFVSGGEPTGIDLSPDSFLRSDGASTFYPAAQTTSNSVTLSGAVLSPTSANSPDGTGVIGEFIFTIDSELSIGEDVCLSFGLVEFSDPDQAKSTPIIYDEITCFTSSIAGDFTDSSVACGKPDGTVDFNDLLLFAAVWGKSETDDNWCPIVNVSASEGTQVIDFDDLIIFASNWGKSVGD